MKTIKILRSKKGNPLSAIEAIFLGLVSIIVAGIIAYMIFSFIYFSTDTFVPESSGFANNLMNSENGLSYYDQELGRVYPGLIDIPKLIELDSTGTVKYHKLFSQTFNLSTLSNEKLGARIIIFDNANKFSQVPFNKPGTITLEKYARGIDTNIKDEKRNANWYNSVKGEPLVLYFNENFFRVWSRVAGLNLAGPGGAKLRQYYYNVNTIHNETGQEKIYNGVVIIEVVMKNT